MYIGDLKQWEREEDNLPDYIKPWLQKLASARLDALPPDRYDLGNGNYLNIDEAVTLPAMRRQTECHRLYADVQILLEGEEIIGWQPLCDLGEMTEDNGAKDAYFYNPPVEKDRKIVMRRKRTFVVFFPSDGHRCLCAPTGGSGAVRKAVLKVKLPAGE